MKFRDDIPVAKSEIERVGYQNEIETVGYQNEIERVGYQNEITWSEIIITGAKTGTRMPR
jgi:hypothetical protein